ncbi:O-antigen ligase family protein [Fulvimarina sp. 2208YS6-2-32]|uniref:O-antigen ligase family protein n=1 Tax=Fulvimarina uroteuthidis TaxID=3098149 RepID=A0ABU5I081_9HYPH|nr:O-antigen ligase family protein [Fulvimarina sp. 2208YS6-2-32]MDY8108793.1 O-antigen ligase family protein [Fulvimarina sp. 2208YS6-2-32]
MSDLVDATRPAAYGTQPVRVRRGDAAIRWHDWYFATLLLAVAGYAIFGKGFAYAGLPPIFPAEVLLALGLLTFVWPRPSGAILSSPALVLVLAGIAWTLIRTVPYIGQYGIDAMRDAVILVYGLFAIVVANLILERPERIRDALGWATIFFSINALVVIPIYLLQTVLGESMPRWPVSLTPILQVRGGEVAVHLCATAVFALLAFKRSSVLWTIVLVVDIAFVASLSRGGLVSIAIPLALAIVLSGRIRPFLLAGAVIAPLLALFYVGGLQIQLPGIQRTIDVGQIVDNVVSIAGSSGDKGLDDTKEWRIGWWQQIVDYTLFGEYFWTGKGFGINLAFDDGYAAPSLEGQPLRSPHNGNMTILARAGVPGMVLWIAILATWFSTLLWHVAKARLAGDRDWSNLFIFLTCYLLAAFINASFDVALEGPMIGVVFWVVFGAGIGSVMVYTRLETR